eukprot:491243-Pelagomonas_calceolata.AAC.7
MVTRVKVICLPVYQRQWMWHAYTSTTEELKSSGGTSSNARLLSTDESPGTLGQKLQEMQAQLSSKVKAQTCFAIKVMLLQELQMSNHRQQSMGSHADCRGGDFQALDVQVSLHRLFLLQGAQFGAIVH